MKNYLTIKPLTAIVLKSPHKVFFSLYFNSFFKVKCVAFRKIWYSCSRLSDTLCPRLFCTLQYTLFQLLWCSSLPLYRYSATLNNRLLQRCFTAEFTGAKSELIIIHAIRITTCLIQLFFHNTALFPFSFYFYFSRTNGYIHHFYKIKSSHFIFLHKNIK